MFKHFLIITIFLFTKKAFTQSVDSIQYKKNAVYLEGLGNAGGYGFYSFNYERKIGENMHGFITVRVGFSSTYGHYPNYWVPILLNQVYHKERKHHFEIGGGISMSFFSDLSLDSYYTGPTANLMYRYQKPGGKFIFRIGWTPVLYFLDVDPLTTAFYFLTPGASLGFAF